MSRLLSRLMTRALMGMLISTVAVAQPVQDTTTHFQYDLAGNLTEVKDSLGHATTYKYDALMRRWSATDAKAGETLFAYDGLDQLTQVTDARKVVTTYNVDGLGNLNLSTSGDTGATASTYDEAGNLATRTDAKLQRTTYQYDVLGRIELITYHDNSTVAYVYDQGANGVGRLTQVTDASGTIQYGFDSLGRMANEKRTIGGAIYTTVYHYDGAGRPSGITYPSGRVINYVRDTAGRVSQVTTTRGTTTTTLVSNVSYQPFGPVNTVTFGNGRTHSRGYDLDGRVASFSLAAKTMSVKFDAASRIKEISEEANVANGHTFGYDELDRLTNVGTTNSAQVYEYDAVGNRTKKVNNSAITSYTYGTTNNRLTHVGALPIAMDENGSIKDKGNATFNYDARGRMVSANTAIGLVTYTINSLGQRVRKVTPTASTVFHYDMAGKLIAESTTSGTTTQTQEYVYLGDMPVAVLK
ncbi:MAG: hypothetical protein WKG03_05260 [Telluria sp.]